MLGLLYKNLKHQKFEMYYISKEFHFSASHQLCNLPADHPCSRLHGHNYIVILMLKSPSLDKNNFVQDYRELDAFKKYIDDHIDHRHLNDIFKNNQVTAEFMAKYFYDWCKDKIPYLYAVKVSETPKTWATYKAEN